MADVKSNKAHSKREIPSSLRNILDYDTRLTKEVYELFDRRFGLHVYEKYFKYLEISCHGLVWFFFTFSMIYFVPSKMHLLINLLWLLIVDVIIVALVKAFTRRRRPSYNKDDMMTVSVDKFSFPSGHATRALTLALFFAFIHPFHPLIALIIGIWSVSVAISRVLLGRHHVLDVAGGVAIAIAQSMFLNWTYFSEESARGIGDFFFGEDPWSSG